MHSPSVSCVDWRGRRRALTPPTTNQPVLVYDIRHTRHGWITSVCTRDIVIFNGLDAVLEAFRHNPSFALRGVSVAPELAFGHLRYRLIDVPPQSNSPPDCVLSVGRPDRQAALRLEWRIANSKELESPYHCVSDETMKVVVFHIRLASPT